MKILVSNDDGINALGLKILVKELSKIAEVYVCAPDGQRSSNSHHYTISGKIKISEEYIEGAKKSYALSGTPADCAHIGIKVLFPDVDMVVSGINQGPNLSTDFIYSGTIAAAREAFILGIPSIAVSLASFECNNYAYSAKITRRILCEYYNDLDNKNYFLNINVPGLFEKNIKGILVCDKVAKLNYIDNYVFEKTNAGIYLCVGPTNVNIEMDENDLSCDVAAVEHGYVSVTPLYNSHICYDYLSNTIKCIKD